MTATYLIPNKHRGHNKANPRTFRVRVTVTETVEPTAAAQTERANGIADMLWRIRCASAALAGKAAVACLILLALAGCGFTHRQINPGAADAIYTCNRDWMEAELVRRGGTLQPGKRLNGFYDRGTREAFVWIGLNKYQWGGTLLHEVAGHGVEERLPSIWAKLDAYDAPAFDCGSHP
jgi:hypothetical protein